MTKDEALKLALVALDMMVTPRSFQAQVRIKEIYDSIREALAQPGFTKHEVENADDWSEWVCPDPNSYLMKCCDCGLVHEAQFKVVRYKSEDEREECDTVDDPNVQAVFRMRRSEEWTPKDTAYRPGGLAQPEQEPVAWITKNGKGWLRWHRPEDNEKNKDSIPLYTTPPQRKPLTDKELDAIYTGVRAVHHEIDSYVFARAIETAHGIKGEA